MEMVQFEDFEKLDIRVGTILSAEPNLKARKPAYILQIDFGSEIGVKTSSAQITQKYLPDEIVGKKIIAVLNFAPKQIAGVVSEVLVLGTYSEEGVALVFPDDFAKNGDKLG